jgi:NADPH-dependent 2,4-dienoyl-CoA reductase/sulfur reductase-like enzyme
VGGGAAGFAAAEMLRRCGYVGSVLMVSADSDLPVDRPNLSKDYLAGTAPEEWVPLKPESWYVERDIDLRLNTEVVNLHVAAREIELESGDRLPYDRLLLATGAEPVRLALPGASQDNVAISRPSPYWTAWTSRFSYSVRATRFMRANPAS